MKCVDHDNEFCLLIVVAVVVVLSSAVIGAKLPPGAIGENCLPFRSPSRRSDRCRRCQIPRRGTWTSPNLRICRRGRQSSPLEIRVSSRDRAEWLQRHVEHHRGGCRHGRDAGDGVRDQHVAGRWARAVRNGRLLVNVTRVRGVGYLSQSLVHDRITRARRHHSCHAEVHVAVGPLPMMAHERMQHTDG